MKLNTNKGFNQRLKKLIPGATHYNFNFPWDGEKIHFKDGYGQFLIDFDGNKYVDFYSKFGANILGHRNSKFNAELIKNILEKTNTIDHFGDEEIKILEYLLSNFPSDCQVRFSLSGTEAINNAMRLSRAFTGKKKILRFVNHYHGSSDDLLGGITVYDKNFNTIEKVGDLRWTEGRKTNPFEDIIIIDWNNLEIVNEIIASSDYDIAAVIMEPICINGGGLKANINYFKGVRDLCTKHNIILIFDEIITGFRLNYGSCDKLVGVTPDVWVFGKALSGGVIPLSCFIARGNLMKLYESKRVTHGGTFNGYNLGIRAMGINLKILSKKVVYDETIELSSQLIKSMELIINRLNLDISILGHPMAIVISLNYSLDINNKIELSEVLRNLFLKNNIILAPPLRIYPTISFNYEALSYVQEKLKPIFTSFKEYIEK